MNKISELYNIKYPIIQGGMIWCSGWKLASAVSNSGGLGLIGSGSMYPEILEEHIQKCRKATNKPFGVNLPLLYHNSEKHIEVILKEKIKIVFTSAGNPKKYTSLLQKNGIIVTHVVANVKFAKKCEEAGVDAIVAEGFEAGGHNGYEETTIMALIPAIRQAVSLPLIAAGGIGSGRTMLAALSLGANGIQIGSRFAASIESSGHNNFKQKILEAQDGDTKLTLKQLVPVRLIRNKFVEEVQKAEYSGASTDKLLKILGKARAKAGMFEGDVDDGELEIGQISSIINRIDPVSNIMKEILSEFEIVKNQISKIKF